MKNTQNPAALRNRTFLLLLITFSLSTSVMWSQIPSNVQKAIDNYYFELLKVYQAIESKEVDEALQKIDELIPSIEKKAKVLADLANDNPELLAYLDSDRYMEELQDKSYFKELMRIMQSETFSNKFVGSSELQSKLEEVENIIESYTETDASLAKSDSPTGVSFSITIAENHKYSGTYNILAYSEEEAIAYKDDLDYLRVDIAGEVDGKEAVVSFFVDDEGTGRQEWATEGHFVFELMDQEGELLISLWGSEDMGYFEIEAVDGPGSFVTGKIKGECLDGNGDSEATYPIEASFNVPYVEFDY